MSLESYCQESRTNLETYKTQLVPEIINAGYSPETFFLRDHDKRIELSGPDYFFRSNYGQKEILIPRGLPATKGTYFLNVPKKDFDEVRDVLKFPGGSITMGLGLGGVSGAFLGKCSYLLINHFSGANLGDIASDLMITAGMLIGMDLGGKIGATIGIVLHDKDLNNRIQPYLNIGKHSSENFDPRIIEMALSGY